MIFISKRNKGQILGRKSLPGHVKEGFVHKRWHLSWTFKDELKFVR